MDTSCEPMDVDLSTNSANISFNDHEVNYTEPLSKPPLEESKSKSEPEVWNVKKFHIIRDKTNSKQCNNTILLVVAFIVLLLSSIIYCLLGIRCTNELDLKELKIKLQNRLYGQPEVIDNLVKSLGNDENSKILFLYGGTGVGKTFTISLALANFWNSSNVYHYTMPSFVNTFSTDTMLGLNICDSSIMVVDDLKQDNFDIKKQVAEVIRKSSNLNKKITVILIYNCDIITRDLVKSCDDTFHLELSHEFNDIEADKSYIKFRPLTQDILKMCIEDELNGKSVKDIDFYNILNNFNVTLDGCKGVYKKIKFLNLL